MSVVGLLIEDSFEDPPGSSIFKRTTFVDRCPSTEMGRRVLAELFALLRPAVDSGSESWRVDLGRWEEAFEFCWFGAPASQGRLKTSESKKAAKGRSMVTEFRFPFRSISKVCAWRCRTEKGPSEGGFQNI